jgi:hypothetical protein
MGCGLPRLPEGAASPFGLSVVVTRLLAVVGTLVLYRLYRWTYTGARVRTMRIVPHDSGSEDRDRPLSDDIELFDGLLDLTLRCPLCARDGRGDVAVGYLQEGERHRWAIVGLGRWPWEETEPNQAGHRPPGAVITSEPGEPVHLQCPHPRCGRTLGPFTLRGLARRARQGQPLVAQAEPRGLRVARERPSGP